MILIKSNNECRCVLPTHFATFEIYDVESTERSV